MRISCAVKLTAPWGLLLAAAASAAADVAPVAAWTFNGELRGIVRDIARDRHHAVARAPTRYLPSPGGSALEFDGTAMFLEAANHLDLVVTNTVTLDAWIWLEEATSAQPQCIVDKGGERYRLQIGSDGAAMFGLKTEAARLDLSGPKLTPKMWHRITGVFDRPSARLYVDGKLAAERQWDHDIGPGGNLYIGSKGGVTYFLRSRIDELHIYREPRPPAATDAPTQAKPGGAAVRARLEVTELDGGLRVDTGAMQLELTADGAIASLTVGGERVVEGNTAPPVFGALLDSPVYHGFSDHTQGRLVEGACRVTSRDHRQIGRDFRAAYNGELSFGDGDRTRFRRELHTSAGSPIVSERIELTREGAFENRFIRELGVRLPLALNRRKRVVQGGDRGLQWNTRHWYQFHVGPMGTLLPEPDHNIWRHFAVEQYAPTDFHIWRAESRATSPLSMQRGLAAPGWIAAYDERAGVLLAYRDMAPRAPKSLWLNADGSGEAIIYLHPPTQAALDPSSPQAAAIFGAPHAIDWLAFKGDLRFTQPDLALAKHWNVPSLSSDPPARSEPPCADVELWRAPAADDEAPLMSGGVPLPRGKLRDAGNVRLLRDRADVPLQTKPLAYWPDGSIKWLLLTFPPNGGAVAGASGTGDTLTFHVTRRDGSREPYELHFGDGVQNGAPGVRVSAEQQGDSVTIDTGPLRLELRTGEVWLTNVSRDGRDVLAPGEGAGSFVDFLHTTQPYPCASMHAAGDLDDGEFVAERIELEETGPLRAVVRLEGMTSSSEPTRIIIRLEAYAGRSVVRVFQTAEFLHKDPRTTFVRRMGVSLVAPGLEGARVTVGGQDGPVALPPARRAGIRQHSHLGYEAWHQEGRERFRRVDEAKHRCRGWLDVSNDSGGVTVVLRDMWQQFPNELVADSSTQRLTAYFWPESGPVMDVRRYSNYPHKSQGESAGSESNWVAQSYYGRDVFVGISKTHEILWYFHGPDTSPEQIDAVAADFQRRPLVYAGAQWYHDCGVLLPHPVQDPQRFARVEANLAHYARFWMHHQKLWGWYGIWDYGDVQHNFKGGYGSIVAPEKLMAILADKPEDLESVSVRSARMQDYRPNHDWAFDNGRWGWSNTEGLPNLFMQTHYLRTGDRDVFFFAEAMARHVRDVDMRHDGEWFGRGTRHGVQHWSDGNHEERQTTHSEFRYHHYLSGDMRSRDFARQLYERIYSQQSLRVHAAHSGRLQGLLTQWEMTGDEDIGQLLERYVACFLTPEGLCESPSVRFPGAELQQAGTDVNAGNMFFHTFGAMHALLEYYELTGGPDLYESGRPGPPELRGDRALRDAIIRTADAAMKRDDPGNLRKALVFAARCADDPAPYRKALNDWIRRSGYRTLCQVVPHNTALYAGPNAFVRGSVAGSLFFMNDVLYMMTVMDGDPRLTEEQLAQLKQGDESGGPRYDGVRGSWQSEYDVPELAEYLRIKHAQP